MKALTISCILVLVSFSLLAQAQPIAVADRTVAASPWRPSAYGTADETAISVLSLAFDPNMPTTPWQVSSAYARYVSGGNGCCLDAPVVLPAGALITGLELEACDTSATGSMSVALVRCFTPAQNICSLTGVIASTGAVETPGCGFFRVDFTHTVDNIANRYLLEAFNTDAINGSAALYTARVYYKLQVSQPPATPTFTDVPPSHPFFQFIEALAASGITAGCSASPPQYCPDATLTRGQMAVFLARALGLHWTP